jgi:hypothetical protein
MAVSQNGYPANDRRLLAAYRVGARTFWLRADAPGWLLWHFLDWFHHNVRPIDTGPVDDWSYAERPIRGSDDELSNHASGTAADVDATRWPLGVEPTAYLTYEEIRRVRAQLLRYEGAIRWGGDYVGRKDPMHFEIDRDATFCARIKATLREDHDDMPSLEEIDQLITRRLQTEVIDRYVVGAAGQPGALKLFEALQVLTCRDPFKNPVSQAVVDRPVSGGRRLWEVLRDEDAEHPPTAADVARAIPAGIAAEVADLLAARLQS